MPALHAPRERRRSLGQQKWLLGQTEATESASQDQQRVFGSEHSSGKGGWNEAEVGALTAASGSWGQLKPLAAGTCISAGGRSLQCP